MYKVLTLAVRKFLNSMGYEIVRYQDSLTSIKVGNWLQNLKIETIIDIGSNEGQFIQSITKILPGGRIYAFEPIPSCYTRLIENTRTLQVKAFNCGLSDVNGHTEINVSNNLVSSSILGMKDLHRNMYPESAYQEKQTIELRRLDDVFAAEAPPGNMLVKIDVQGYEEKVLTGGTQTIRKASAVIIETSFEPLYEGQWLFDNVYRYFMEAGFRFIGFADQALSKRTGIPLYGDAIFIRKDKLNGIF